MVEEQAGVQVVGEVDEKTAVALTHLVERAARRRLLLAGRFPVASPFFLVLLGTFLALPGLDEQAAARRVEHRADHLQGQAEPLLRLGRVHRGRRRVLLHVDPFLVQVHGQVVFRHVAVVDAKTLHALALGPGQQGGAVLQQPVGQVLARAARFGRDRGPGVHRPLVPLALAAHEQLALERPVEQPVALGPGHAGHLGQVRVGGEEAERPAAEAGAEGATEAAVEVFDRLPLGQPLAVGRVGEHTTALARALHPGQLPLADDDHLAQAGGDHVLARLGDHLGVGVVADELRPGLGQAALLALQGLGGEPLPQLRVVLVPGHEAELLAQQARGRVAEHERRLDEQGAAAAHRVEQDGLLGGPLGPAGQADNGRGQALLERRLTRAGAVAAAVQAVAGQIQGERGGRALDVQVDADVRVEGVHVGPFAEALAELVGDGVLDPQGGELAVGDGRVDQGGVHREGRFPVEMVVPQDLAAAGVEGVRVRRVEVGQFEQDARGEPGPEAGPVAALQGAGPVDRAEAGGDILAAEPGDLLGDQRLQAGAAGGGEKQGLFLLFSRGGRTGTQGEHGQRVPGRGLTKGDRNVAKRRDGRPRRQGFMTRPERLAP